MLVEDQRYCLQCGARRGKPRIDFTAFWKPLSPTGEPREQSRDRSEARCSSDGPHIARSPSRRLVSALAVGTLAVGALAGAALGPAPASSPADGSTLAQQAIAALVARAGHRVQPSPPVSPPVESGRVATSAAGHKAQAASTPASVKASAPAPSTSAPSADTPSSEGSFKESSPSEGASKESSGEDNSSSGNSGAGNSGEGKKAGEAPVKLPPIKHVWLIALSGETIAAALAQPQSDPYLAKRLAPQGALLSGYTLSSISALANGIALLSGQGVNVDTEQNCPTYAELQPPTVSAANGLAEGVGCVYPATVKTLPDELTGAGLTWKAYVQNMETGTAGTTGADAARTTGATGSAPSTALALASASTPAPASASISPTTSAATPAPPTTLSCLHPELGAPDPNHVPTPGDPYLTFRNPFVYFHSLLDGGACASNDVDLNRLQGDLQAPASTPNLSWIVPSACDDGSSAACAPGAPAGPGPADHFLEEVVPQILATTAYRKGGLIAIVPDTPPASPMSAAAKPVGALLISPFVRSGTRVSEHFDDFSLLKSLARLYGVLPLGHANDPSAVSFGATVYRTTK